VMSSLYSRSSVFSLSEIAYIGLLNRFDPHDPTSLHPQIRARFPTDSPSSWTIGVPQEYNLPDLHPSMSRAWSIAISKLQSSGHKVTKVNLPRTKEALSAYYVLATAEAASNLARYDGIRYGYHFETGGYKEDILTSRALGFGDEVRRRILLGNFTLSARYVIDVTFLIPGRLRVISFKLRKQDD
jgi:aspartyl-tRNA(Asn)/glutamyl-tRNA(Gln) amidotransferase subunit A